MPALLPLGPRQQLLAGRLAHRMVQLFVGLILFGISMGMLVRGNLGLAPWDVLHQGITYWTPLSFGTVAVITSFVVLAFWIPLRQWPGFGTVANAIVIGITADATLSLLPDQRSLALRWALTVGGVLLNGLAGALYIGSQLGPGPRDGLMTGLVHRTGRSVRLVRTAIEVGVLAIGWLLGGTVGLGTVLYAVAIGPLVHALLPVFTVRLDRPGDPHGPARSGTDQPEPGHA